MATEITRTRFTAEHLGRRAYATGANVWHDSLIAAMTEDGQKIALSQPNWYWFWKKPNCWYDAENVRLVIPASRDE